MYRPTVRYDDAFRDYVNDLFHSTYLDRNQIIRAALFSAAYSLQFRSIIEPYKKKDVPFPSPKWRLDQEPYWMEQCPEIKERGKDVNVKCGRTEEAPKASCNDVRRRSGSTKNFPESGESVTRPTGEIPAERITIKNQGRISFTFN